MNGFLNLPCPRCKSIHSHRELSKTLKDKNGIETVPISLWGYTVQCERCWSVHVFTLGQWNFIERNEHGAQV